MPTSAFGASRDASAGYVRHGGSLRWRDQPTLIDQPGVAGVYQTRVELDRPGFWTVEVTAQVDGTERTGIATFSVADRHQVPGVGEPAPASRNLTVDSDTDPAAIDSRAATGGTVPDPSLHADTIANGERSPPCWSP